MTTQNYWTQRTKQNRAKAIKLADTYSKREQKLFKRSYKEIMAGLNDVLVDLNGQNDYSRTEVWRMNKYLALRNIIERQCDELAAGQISMVDEAVENVFYQTIGAQMKDFEMKDNFNLVTDRIRAKVLNNNWSGKNYSQRVWTNRNALADKLQKSIEDYIILGKSPNEIKRKLADDLKVGFHVADRLIRTETAHIFTEASLETYKEYGIEKVKYLHGSAKGGCCDDCLNDDGKEYELGTQPLLPRHPNCHCCYVPVVELTKMKR